MMILKNNNYNNNTQNTYNTYTLTGEEKKNNTYLLHPNYAKTTLPNMQHKHHVH